MPVADDSTEGITPALEIRKDRTPTVLRKLATAEEDARVARRMLAIANTLDGMSRKAAAEVAGSFSVPSGAVVAASRAGYVLYRAGIYFSCRGGYNLQLPAF